RRTAATTGLVAAAVRCYVLRLRRRRSTQHALDVRLHRLQLLTPVSPAVGTSLGEVEHPVLATGLDVLFLERLVRAKGEALQELGVEVAAAQLVGLAVAAVHPDAGVVGNELVHVDHRVVALPR